MQASAQWLAGAFGYDSVGPIYAAYKIMRL